MSFEDTVMREVLRVREARSREHVKDIALREVGAIPDETRIREAARDTNLTIHEMRAQATSVIGELMEDCEVPASVRAKLGMYLVDRILGRPASNATVNVNESSRKQIVVMKVDMPGGDMGIVDGGDSSIPYSDGEVI